MLVPNEGALWHMCKWSICQQSDYAFKWQRDNATVVMHQCSVANAAVYPQNWATLKLPAAGQKLLGGWPFHPSTPGSSFFFKFVSFLSIHRVFERFQCPRTFFSTISGIKMSWRAINIDYPLHAEVNNLIVFLPNWVILIILQQKHPHLGNWEYNYLIKIGLL